MTQPKAKFLLFLVVAWLLVAELAFWTSVPKTTAWKYDGREEDAVALPYKPEKGIFMDFHVTLQNPLPLAREILLYPSDCIEKIALNGESLSILEEERCSWFFGAPLAIPAGNWGEHHHIEVTMHNADALGALEVQLDRSDIPLLFHRVNLALSLSAILYLILTLTGVNTAAAAVMGVGTALRCHYMFRTTMFVRAYDAPSHLDYVKYVAHEWSIPAITKGCEMHQPPLYYFIAGIFWRVGEMLGFDDRLRVGSLQGLALCLSIVSLVLLLAIARQLFGRFLDWRNGGLPFLGLLAFIPPYVSQASRITNDDLLQPIFLALILLALRWWKTQKQSLWLWMSVLVSVGLLVKTSALVFLPIMAVLLLLNGESFHRKAELCLILGISLSMIWGWYAYERFVVEAQADLEGSFRCMDDALKVPFSWKNIFTFNPLEVIREPFVNTRAPGFRREYFFEFFLRSGFFNECNFGDALRSIARTVLGLAMLLIGYGVYGLCHLVRNKHRRSEYLLLILFLLVPLLAQILMFSRSPYSCQQDFRYFPFTTIPVAFSIISGIIASKQTVQMAGHIFIIIFVLGCWGIMAGAPIYC